MQTTLKLILCAVYCQAMLAGLNYLHPGWFREAAGEVGRLVEMQRLEGELQVQLKALQGCQEAKKQVVSELLAQRLTLREAGARFQELNAEQGGARWWRQYRECYGGDSDEERHCREVIRLTTQVLMVQTPDQADAVSTRLHEQLQFDLETSYDGVGGF